MPSPVTLYAGTGADDADFGSDSWTNPGNIVSDNATYAETDNVFQYSHYLKGTNFGFAIPAGATINGIVVEIERLNTTAATTNCVDARVRIVKGGTVGTTDKADTVTTWPETATVKTYGSSSDLWGETWTVADINASNFGVVLATAAELAKVPKSDSTVTWNATALASMQSEATDALNAYGGPTNAQMEARTIAAASYATAANQTTIIAKTNLIPASPAAVGSAMTLTTGERDAIATATLKLDFTGLTGEATRSMLNALRKLMNKWSISGSTLTVCKEDDSTAAYTQTVSTSSSADPVTGLDTV